MPCLAITSLRVVNVFPVRRSAAMMKFAVQGLIERGVPSRDVYVSMERNMKCALGFCGHCQFGPEFVCRDGPVFPYAQIQSFLDIREF